MKNGKSNLDETIRLARELLVDIRKLLQQTFLLALVSSLSTLASCFLVWHLLKNSDSNYVDFFLASGCIVMSILNWEMSWPAIKTFPELIRKKKFIQDALIELESDHGRTE